MRPFGCLGLVLLALTLVAPRSGFAGTLRDDGRAGVVSAVQGVALVRPVGRERWTPLDERSLLFPGDVVRTEARGAHALEFRLVGGARLVAGPGTSIEVPDGGGLRLLRGELEVRPKPGSPVRVAGPGGWAQDLAVETWLRADDTTTKGLAAAPPWLVGYRSSTSEEWMGSLVAKVDGRDVPLSVGYHKVTVEIRDQIARTTVEESFVNATSATLEGVFSFPLPADASISGFGMWIGDELVEADLVERERARAIYEDILRRKKDPGLLEWEGGNLFKARVFPIFPGSEKRIRIRYTQVLPLEGDAYRYRYALRSELLRAHPLRELSMSLSILSAAPIREVASATHPVTVRGTEHEAVVEFGAQEYVPERDFDLAVTVGRGEGLSAVAHRRGEDGYFMLLVAPPDPAASGWQRDLVPEGPPLDLVLVADTSGSMDEAARGAQAAFLAALLAQASPKDRFRLLACDVEPRWLVEAPTPVTEASVDAALSALEARRSLGWTDLERAFEAALPRVGPTTQVVYVGDGVPTSGEADPVAVADRLRRLGQGRAGTCHAVSTSSTYEQGVLDAIASIGGGSVRRADDAPTTAARALLDEVARPGLRDARLAIEGVPTAKVYPQVLPPRPLSEQQVVLGRFLPGAQASTARIVLTGTVAGKPVRYATTLAVPASDEGNSFLPRLWARRHLDALLAQGRDARTKEEIVAFSREHEIMTPYTSFLVLENDEDRAKYGVERGVHARDAEGFFADARDRARLEIARQQAVTARRYRLELRRTFLRELEGLGRDLGVATAVGWSTEGKSLAFSGPSGDWSGGKPGRQSSHGERSVTRLGAVTNGLEDLEEAEGDRAYDEPSSGPEESKAAPPGLREPTDPEAPSELASSELANEEEADAYDELAKSAEAADKDGMAESGLRFKRRADRPGGPVVRAFSKFVAPLDFESRRSLGGPMGGGRGGPGVLSADAFGFPYLPPPPTPATPPAPAPAWDREILEALASLDRRPALATLDGGLLVTATTETLHPRRGTVLNRHRAGTLVSARRWYSAQHGFRAPTLVAWVSETERHAVDGATRLGRVRAATEADRAAAPLPLRDRSLEALVSNLAAAYRRPPTVAREEGRLTITFLGNEDPAQGHRLVIDPARRVLLEEATGRVGGPFAITRFSDFVEVAGRWWARRVEVLDLEGRLTNSTRLEVTTLDPAGFSSAFDAAVAPFGDVITLGAAEPTLLEAQQAVRDGRAGLADRVVVALDDLARGRFDELWEVWPAAEALMSGRPGAEWMRLTLLVQSRRGPEFLALATKMAKAIPATDPSLAPWSAHRLDAMSGSLGARERLGLVEALEPAWRDADPDADLWSIAGRQRLAQALQQAGETRRARAAWASLAEDRPDDVEFLLAYAESLRRDQDLAAAVALVGERATKGGPWSEAEANRLFGTWTSWLFDRRDVAALDAASKAWVEASPTSATARAVRLTTGYLAGRHVASDAWVLEALRAPLGEESDATRRAIREAAVQAALGDGWHLSWNGVPLAWRGPLAELAANLTRLDRPRGEEGARILQHWRFHGTEEARRALAALRADLLAPGAVASLPLPRLGRWQRLTLRDLDDAGRRALAEALLARWRATAEGPDADFLAALVITALPGGGRDEERIAFLRERLGRAGPDDVLGAVGALFEAILGAPHEAAREDEAFALVPRLVAEDPTKRAPSSAERAAAASRALAAWVHEGRRLAALGSPEERGRRTRADAVRAAREALARARAQTAERFAAAVAEASPPLRTWLEVERLGYAAETQADLVRTEGEAREVLDGVPSGSVLAIDGLLAERAAAVLAYAATRRRAPEGLADRVVAMFRARLEAKDRLLDDQRQLFRLLVVLDRVAEVEAALAAWTRPDDVDVTWRVAYANVLAEQGNLRAAATALEAAAAQGDLDASAWTSLAGWYLALGEDTRREAALDAALAGQPPYEIQQRLWEEASRVARHGEGVPAELDPEALRALRFLLRKTPQPANYVSHATALYRPTKDFRVLEALAEGVGGHSPEAAYLYLGTASQVIADVHEEATCDTLAARLTAMLPTARNDVDRRALRLLLVAVESRAAAAPRTDPAHGRRAVAALRAAGQGALVPGERVLLARHLAGIDPSPAPGLAEEQLAQLEALRGGSTEGALERLALERSIAEVLWRRQRRDEAVERLAAALAALRTNPEDALAPEAAEPYETLLQWWTALGRFREAEARLLDDLRTEPRSQRREALQARLFALYPLAIQGRGTTSLGSGAAQVEGATAAMEAYLREGPAYQFPAVAQSLGEALRAAQQAKAVPDAGARYLAFARDRLPALLERDLLATDEVLQFLLPRLAELAGPRDALAVALDQIDREPPWFVRVGMDVWSHLAWQLAHWRRDGGALGGLEARLLPVVLGHLAEELRSQSGQGGGFWHRGNHLFWREKAADFARVAAEVAETEAARPATVLYVARYQRGGLGLAGEAVATLQMAMAHGSTPEDLRHQLADWLLEDRRFAQALPLVEGLLAERPDRVPYHVLGCAVLHGLGRDAEALALLEGAVARWKANATWRMGPAAAFAQAAAKAGLSRAAATWIEDALRMRREAGGGAGPDATLSAWYQILAQARSQLGETDAAVRAAAAAVVAWGRRQDERAQALEQLREVLAKAPDLDAWLARYDAEVAASGLDAPTIRKALGQVLTARGRHEAAAVQWRAARDLDPLDAETHAALVAALDRLEQGPAALDALLASVRLAPKNLPAYVDLAARFERAGQPEEAERARTNLVEAMPSEPDGHRVLATLREQAGRLDLAADRWAQVTRVRPDDPTGWLARAKAERGAGNLVGARTSLEHVLGRDWEERFGDVKGQAAALLAAMR